MLKPESAFSEGLEDVIAAESSICKIDGKASRLSFRGYDIRELAENSNFEETSYLLLFGKLPNSKELADFRARLAAERALPTGVSEELARFPKDAPPMAMLRTAVSLLSFYDKEAEDKTFDSNVRKAVRLIARTATLVAHLERQRKGDRPIAPKTDAATSQAANFLYMLKGKDATAVEAEMLDKYFILLAEHDLNASTFAARIAASTTSDMYSAITAAVGTLKGDLHGSANTRTMESLIEIGDSSRVDAFVDAALRDKKKIMGFGHRIYKGPDPRALHLHEMAKKLAAADPSQAKWFAIAEKMEQAVGERKKLNTNVDFYSAPVLYTLGIPVDLFTTLFAMSRMAGWTAHVLEQYQHNRLIRPVSHYTGAAGLPYIPIQKRG